MGGIKKLDAKKRKKKFAKNLDTEQDDSMNTIKRKPSKAELKKVIDVLQKNAELIVVRKALKYIPHYLKSEGLTKKLLKEIIRLWSESSEKIRVVCLLCLIRIYTKLQDKERRKSVIKKLYTSFMDKCRITKRETMSMIGFMRHSLIELYKLDLNIALEQAQTSSQQLTVTLKNAITHKTEESYKTVLNWQFANCLILLSSFVTSHSENDHRLESLTHQVIQLNLGAIGLLTSPRYYPYYCHLLENLIGLSSSKQIFIPILPMILSILDKIQLPKVNKETNSAKHPKKLTMMAADAGGAKRPHSDDDNDDESDESEKEKKNATYNTDILNHVSHDEAHCPEYLVAIIDKLYELITRYLSSQCHKIAFPELVLFPRVQLKKWIKRNQGTESQRFKALLEKIKLDSDKITESRKSANFAFTDYAAVDAWEKRMKDSNKLRLHKLIEN